MSKSLAIGVNKKKFRGHVISCKFVRPSPLLEPAANALLLTIKKLLATPAAYLGGAGAALFGPGSPPPSPCPGMTWPNSTFSGLLVNV